jgi:hypothetical protein
MQDCTAVDIIQLLLSLRLVQPHTSAAIQPQFTMCHKSIQVAVAILPLLLAFVLIVSFRIVEALN